MYDIRQCDLEEQEHFFGKEESPRMKWLNRASHLSLMGFSVLIFFFCVRLGIGKPQSPGPGFMPLLAAVLLFCLSFATIIVESRGAADDEGRKSSLGLKELTKPVCLVISLIGYAFLLNVLGYPVATFLLLFTLFSVTEPQQWRKNLVIAALVAVFSFLVFDKWLRVQLPDGIFLIGW
jgi:putative tricarboxylic transport membrane protein